MTKTIEEAAWDFARKQWGRQVPSSIDKIADMMIDFGNHLMELPLAYRMTKEEKERVRETYKHHLNAIGDCYAHSMVRAELERIFGKELFEEG